MEAAFVYRVTEDPVALDKVHRMLRGTVDIPIGWDAGTIRTYRQPVWRRWWKENRAKVGK